jgi:hypothetical protein
MNYYDIIDNKLNRSNQIYKQTTLTTYNLQVTINAPILKTILQCSFDTGELPKDWRDANISSIFKKGDKHLPENYRPV